MMLLAVQSLVQWPVSDRLNNIKKLIPMSDMMFVHELDALDRTDIEMNDQDEIERRRRTSKTWERNATASPYVSRAGLSHGRRKGVTMMRSPSSSGTGRTSMKGTQWLRGSEASGSDENSCPTSTSEGLISAFRRFKDTVKPSFNLVASRRPGDCGVFRSTLSRD